MRAQNDREDMPEALKGTDIVIIPPHRALLNQQMAPDLAICIYVVENEPPVFWQYVLPLARSMQQSGNGISIYSVGASAETLPDLSEVSILELDAETLTVDQLKALLRGCKCFLFSASRRKAKDCYLSARHSCS